MALGFRPRFGPVAADPRAMGDGPEFTDYGVLKSAQDGGQRPGVFNLKVRGVFFWGGRELDGRPASFFPCFFFWLHRPWEKKGISYGG